MSIESSRSKEDERVRDGRGGHQSRGGFQNSNPGTRFGGGSSRSSPKRRSGNCHAAVNEATGSGAVGG